MIHVCYALRDESGLYSKYPATSMLSMFENTHEKITVHLLHDSTLTDELRKKFLGLVYRYDQEIKFYNVETFAPDLIEQAKNLKWNQGIPGRVAIMYRLFIPEILPSDITKVIYLDSDTIVNLDINELWQIDLKDHALGAVTDYSIGMHDETKARAWWQPYIDGTIKDWKNYFNSGVVFFNINNKYVNTGGVRLFERCLEVLKNHTNYWLLDQDSLNVLFKDNFLQLPPQFNFMLGYFKENPIKTQVEPLIYHYVLNSLTMDMKDPFSRLWFEYFMRTPFCKPESFQRIFSKLTTDSERKIEAWKNFSIQTARKSRAFYIHDKNLRAEILNSFGFDPKDLLINELQNLLVTMKDKISDHIFIIHINPAFWKSISDQLSAAGFVENRDFFNAFDMLSRGFEKNGFDIVKVI